MLTFVFGGYFMSVKHPAFASVLIVALMVASGALAQYVETGRDWGAGWDDASMARFSKAGPGGAAGGKYSNMVEWWGLNLGGGYIHNSNSYGKIDMHLFTISRSNWYYTIIDAGIFPFLGGAGFGGRVGYQKFINSSLALRAGGKIGFAFWIGHVGEDRWGDDYWADSYGVEIAPHIQLVKFYRHASVGFGIDFPLYVRAIEACGYYNHCNDVPAVAGGISLYFRLSAY